MRPSASSSRVGRRRQLFAAALAVVVPVVLVLGIGGTLTAAGAHNRSGDFRPVDGLPEPLVAFYGDSFTLGTGASDREHRWSTIVSEERGWNEFNPSMNGLGFVSARALLGTIDVVGQIGIENPVVVISTMGMNDNALMPDRADEIHARIEDDFARFASIPGVRVIAVEPFWYGAVRPASVDEIAGWVRDAAAAHGYDYISGASHWLDGHPEWISPDGVHPNDAGYAEIARRMDAALTRYGLPPR